MKNIKSLDALYHDDLKHTSMNSQAQGVVFLGMIFVCFFIMSNVLAMKVVAISLPNFLVPSSPILLQFSAALIFFPATYLIGDVLTEVYGYKLCQVITLIGLICSTIFLLGLVTVVHIPSSPDWLEINSNTATSYEALLSGYTRTFFAGSFAYLLGQFINSFVLTKLKILTSEKYFSMRIIGSTIVSATIDSSIFIWIVFYGVVNTDAIMTMIAVQITFKVIYEIIMLPITYRLTNFLKRKDRLITVT